MFIKKIFSILIIFNIIFQTICFADDISDDDINEDFLEVSADTNSYSKEPITNSKHIVAIDRKTSTILYEKDANSEVPMASTTKIMTAIITLENCDLNETVEFSKEAANVQGSCLEVTTGTKMSMNDVLYGLMMRSRK